MNDRQRLVTQRGKKGRGKGRTDASQPGEQPAEQPLWPPGFGAWIKIGVVYQRTSARLASLLRPLKLTVAQFDALANLYVQDSISQQMLAQRLLVTKGKGQIENSVVGTVSGDVFAELFKALNP